MKARIVQFKRPEDADLFVSLMTNELSMVMTGKLESGEACAIQAVFVPFPTEDLLGVDKVQVFYAIQSKRYCNNVAQPYIVKASDVGNGDYVGYSELRNLLARVARHITRTPIDGLNLLMSVSNIALCDTKKMVFARWTVVLNNNRLVLTQAV